MEARHAGNDIMDTIREVATVNQEKVLLKETTETSNVITNAGQIIEFARWLSINSNAFRVVRTMIGNQLRTLAWQNKNNAFTENELLVFAQELEKFNGLTKAEDISYKIIQLSTFAELQTGKEEITLRKIKNFTDNEIVKINYKNKDYSRFFYPLDGHANPYGNRHVSFKLVENHIGN